MKKMYFLSLFLNIFLLSLAIPFTKNFNVKKSGNIWECSPDIGETKIGINLEEGFYKYDGAINIIFDLSNTSNPVCKNSKDLELNLQNNKIEFNLYLNDNEMFNISFKDEELSSTTFYFYRFENYFSFSGKTSDYTKTLLYYSLYKENLIPYEQYRLLEQSISEDSIKKMPLITPYSSNESIKGVINWKYNGETYPLKNTKIGLYWHKHWELINHLDYTFTDENGNFSFNIDYDEFDFNRGIYLHIYSENKYVYVSNGLSNYKYDLDFKNEVKNKENINFLINIGDTGSKTINDLAASFLISQHLLLAGKFANSLTNDKLDVVKTIYPGVGTHYTPSTMTISIEGNKEGKDEFDSYKNPDSTIHEYAHYLQHKFNFTANPSFSHVYTFNSCELFEENKTIFGSRIKEEYFCMTKDEAKEKGIKLSWAEGWATYFSISCGKEFIDIFPELPYVGDDYYIFSNNSLINVYNGNFYVGEGTEANIVEFLLKLNKDLNFSHKTLFDVISNNNFIRLNPFYLKLVSNYKNLENKINQVLSDCNIAPYSISKSGNKITREKGGASEYSFPNDTFIVKIYNENNELIVNKTVFKNEYNLTSNEISKLTTNFDVTVTGYSDDYFQNGRYTSYRKNLSK